MPSVRSAVLSSLFATASPETLEARERAIQTHPKPLRRLALLAIHQQVIKQPAHYARLVGIHLDTLHDGTYIGMGGDSVVFRTESDNVTKIHYRELYKRPDQLNKSMYKRKAQYETLACDLGAFILPQTSTVMPHSLVRGRPVPQTIQPMRDLTDLGIFIPHTATIDEKAVERLHLEHPVAAQQLPEFVGASLALHANTGLLPDTCGPGNLSMDTATGQLVLVDSQPATPENTDVANKVLGQLDSLAALLDTEYCHVQ